MGLNGGRWKGFSGGLSGFGGQVSGFGGGRFAVLGSGHRYGCRGLGWRVGFGVMAEQSHLEFTDSSLRRKSKMSAIGGCRSPEAAG